MSNPSEILSAVEDLKEAHAWHSGRFGVAQAKGDDRAASFHSRTVTAVKFAIRALEGRPSLEMAPKPNALIHTGHEFNPECPGCLTEDQIYDEGYKDAEQTYRDHPTERSETAVRRPAGECHGLDTTERVRFYEHDFYPLSNFSAFRLTWAGIDFDTSEAAYHWEKFPKHPNIREGIRNARSAHDAFKLAEAGKAFRRSDWDAVKVDIMRGIVRAKADQHEYVSRKLLATGDRELVEDSWRDDFWGWGEHRDGQNMLGKLWMEVRAELTETQRSRARSARSNEQTLGDVARDAVNEAMAVEIAAIPETSKPSQPEGS